MQLVKTKEESLLEKSFVKRNDGGKKKKKKFFAVAKTCTTIWIRTVPLKFSSVQFGSDLLNRGRLCAGGISSALTRAQFALSLCLSQWSSAIPSINGGGEVRWLPRFSQPVQCKDRKSQGSTPLTTPIKQHCHVTHKAVKKMKMTVPSQ